MTDKPKNLLCVDDQKPILKVLAHTLAGENYGVITALSGAEGLEILAREGDCIQVVLSDMAMPEMDGSVFLGEVAKRYPDTVRMVLSSFSDTSTILGAVNRGEIFRYIVKPWKTEELLMILRQAFEFHELRRSRLALVSRLEQSNKLLERSARVVRSYNRILEHLLAVQPFEETVRIIVGGMVICLPIRSFLLHSCDSRGKTLSLVARWRRGDPDVDFGTFETEEPHETHSGASHQLHRPSRTMFPLVKNDRNVGAMTLELAVDGPLPEEMKEVIETYSRFLAVAVADAELLSAVEGGDAEKDLTEVLKSVGF